MIKFLIVGPHDAGKDTIADYLVSNYNYKYAGPTSAPLCKYALSLLNAGLEVKGLESFNNILGDLSYPEFYENRHKVAMFLYDLGKLIRKHSGQLTLIEELKDRGTEIIVGLREIEELRLFIKKCRPKHIWWVEKNPFNNDPTLEFSYSHLNTICNDESLTCSGIHNNRSIEDLHQIVDKLITFGENQ